MPVAGIPDSFENADLQAGMIGLLLAAFGRGDLRPFHNIPGIQPRDQLQNRFGEYVTRVNISISG